MYIYTKGNREYACEMAKLLDPENVYFNSKVISRNDSIRKHQKDLNLVLCHDSAVLILNDTESVWGNHKENLIMMERYNYFVSSYRQIGFNCKSSSELKSDESEVDGALFTVLQVLKRIHSVFFDPEHGDNLANQDVRQVLKRVRKEVLKGCRLVFSKDFPSDKKFKAKSDPLWKMAEQLSAKCSTEIEPSVTKHVVSIDIGTDTSRWAVQENKFLVNKRWIKDAYCFWKKQPEENFLVDQMTEESK